MEILVVAYIRYLNHMHYHPNDKCAKQAYHRFCDSLRYVGRLHHVQQRVSGLPIEKGVVKYRV